MRASCKSLGATAAAFLALVSAHPAEAYIGPGAGVGAIALTVALVLAVVLLVVGFLWYPLKRMLRGQRKTGAGADSEDRR